MPATKLAPAARDHADRTSLKLARAIRDFFPFPCHPCTATRYILRGVKLRDGSTLKMVATATPGGWVLNRSDVVEFFATLTADRCGAPAPTQSPDYRFDAALDAAGF